MQDGSRARAVGIMVMSTALIGTLLVAPAIATVPDGAAADSTVSAGRGPAPGARPAESAVRRAPNPLAAYPWGVHQGGTEPSWDPYLRSRGQERRLLGKIALTPKARWFTSGLATGNVRKMVRRHISESQAGNPDALVQMTIFRMDPWGRQSCRQRSAAAVRDYRRWIDRFAAAVGNTPSAIILQPDAPKLLCNGRAKPQLTRLVAYSARKLSALPRTSVYLEAGAGDWPAPGQGGVRTVLRFLVPAGIAHTRGFALNSTHYSSTRIEVARGAAIVRALNRRGITGKKFVVNTSSNGRPVVFGRFQRKFRSDKRLSADHAPACRTPKDRRLCITLGIPPTTDVAAPRWGLPARTRRLARRHVDAYLWFGRPWQCMQATPFMSKRAQRLVRSSPYRAHLPATPAVAPQQRAVATASAARLPSECRRW